MFPVDVDKVTVDDVLFRACTEETGVGLQVVGKMANLDRYFILRLRKERYSW